MGAKRMEAEAQKIEAMVSLGPGRGENGYLLKLHSFTIIGDRSSHQDGEKIDPDKQDSICFVKSN